MKILIANTFYYPNMKGGAEQSVKLLAEGLAKKGHEVAIYCVDGKENEDTEINGIKIFRRTCNNFDLFKYSYEKDKVGKFEKLYQKLLCYYNRKCGRDFKKICLDFKPDIIHTNSIYGMSNIVWKIANKLKIKLVHTVRDIGMISPVQYGHKVNPIFKKMHIIFYRTVCKYLDGITAPSSYTLNNTDSVLKIDAKVKKVIYNSVDIDSDRFEECILDKYNRNNSKIKFMYAGRLVYFKGVEYMLKAFSKLDNFECELHICGDGPMLDIVKESADADSRIIVHGKLNNEELAKCYDECDVLLVPSFWPEPFGRIIIEGNMHGLPVIAGNCGGMPEIIEHTKGGVIYNTSSEDELLSNMKLFLSREVIKSYYENIRKNIFIYDIEKQISAFEELYKEL